MKHRRLVLDTNVLVAALRSRRGASFELLSRLGKESGLELNLSVPLVLEYEEVAKRPGTVPGLSSEDIDAVIDYLCAVSKHREIFFLWRPHLKDPKDDMVLELAVAAGADIVTFNLKDFSGTETFGVRALTPQTLLKEIGATDE
jgi:putative PIN family toxin of toxin-antitoxin system